MSADRKAIIEHVNAAFAENNLEKVLSFCTDDFIWTMVGDETVKGKDAIRKWIASMNVQPPRLMIQQIVELTAFVIQTDQVKTRTQAGQEAGRAV